MNQYRLWAVWIGLAIAVVGLSAFIAIHDRRERHLFEQLSELWQEEEDLRLTNKRATAAEYDAKCSYAAIVRRDGMLREMLRECTSCDDFIVREGPRIVWSKLEDTGADVQKLGLYLPLGNHRLRGALFAEQHPANSPPQDADKVTTGVEVCSWELGPQAGVYEVQVRWSKDAGNAQIVLVQADSKNEPRRAALPIRAPAGELAIAEPGFAFPCQLKLEGDTWRWPSGELRPVTLLAAIPVQWANAGEGDNAEFALWIESEAPVCIAAAEAVSQIHLLTGLYLPLDDTSDRQLTYQQKQDARFSKTFEPYEGSYCFYFRAGAFESARRANTGPSSNDRLP